MEKETAKMLTESVAKAVAIAIDSQNKLSALEAVLQKQNPALFREYSQILEAVRQGQSSSSISEGFATLESKLARPDQ
jgi:hypothetical protein